MQGPSISMSKRYFKAWVEFVLDSHEGREQHHNYLD